jgi:alkaline phosphatase D
MDSLRKNRLTLKNQKGYLELMKDIPLMAAWDDHDYGINGVSLEFPKKSEHSRFF